LPYTAVKVPVETYWAAGTDVVVVLEPVLPELVEELLEGAPDAGESPVAWVAGAG
jgi:hypothetical protein